MKYRIFIATICFLFGLSQAWGQIETTVNFSKSNKVVNTKAFRFSIYSSADTLIVFNSADNKDLKQTKVSVPANRDTIVGVFEYSDDFKEWHKVEYPIVLEKELKRIEIQIYFSANHENVEFLQDFTVDKFYTTNRVSIQSAFKKQIGERPLFMIMSNCDTTFWGCNESNYFYGTMKMKTDSGWLDFRGSYCDMTNPGKPLHKSDTVYSWVPNYNPGDEYKIEKSGTYKYSVAMGLEKYSDGVPMKLIEQGQTRMRTRIFYELETEFVVK
jgi:hypothetical protein